MVLKVLLKFPPTLALVHGWLFPAFAKYLNRKGRCITIFRVVSECCSACVPPELSRVFKPETLLSAEREGYADHDIV